MHEFYQNIVRKYAEEYYEKETAKAGINGPYLKEETYVRTTAHWTVTFSIMYQITKEMQYRDIVEKFARSLVQTVE